MHVVDTCHVDLWGSTCQIINLPSKVEAIAVVAREFGLAGGINHNTELQAKDCEEGEGEHTPNLRSNIGEIEGLEAGADALHARQTCPGEGGDVSGKGEHCDATMDNWGKKCNGTAD